jgi:hypothetical protein
MAVLLGFFRKLFLARFRHAKLRSSGGSSSAGRASVCGTECRGFDPRLPPQLDLI